MVKIVGKVGSWRHRFHGNALDHAFRRQVERYVGVGHELPVGPARNEGIELEMLQRAG